MFGPKFWCVDIVQIICMLLDTQLTHFQNLEFSEYIHASYPARHTTLITQPSNPESNMTLQYECMKQSFIKNNLNENQDVLVADINLTWDSISIHQTIMNKFDYWYCRVSQQISCIDVGRNTLERFEHSLSTSNR